MSNLPGTQGYANEASDLIERYEAISFEGLHAWALPLVPPAPAMILDIGAGTGRDAAGFAALGHRVLAVEPTDELRNAGARLHASPLIEWLDDGLPDLARVRGRGESFDIVMMTAVLMHLDAGERARAIASTASLLATGGKLLLTLRHGPIPAGRRMFEVSGAETSALGAAHGLTPIHLSESQSLQGTGYRNAGVTWTRLALARA